jgi:hypothetical protein
MKFTAVTAQLEGGTNVIFRDVAELRPTVSATHAPPFQYSKLDGPDAAVVRKTTLSNGIVADAC